MARFIGRWLCQYHVWEMTQDLDSHGEQRMMSKQEEFGDSATVQSQPYNAMTVLFGRLKPAFSAHGSVCSP